MSFAFSYNPDQEPPFVIYLAHEDKTQGSWRPCAMLGLTPALRTSGFLSAIGPEELHSLLVLLSFLAPDGRLMAFTLSLAQTLGLPPAKARARFERLCEMRWLGQPIVFATQLGDGLDGFAPIPGFIPLVEEPTHDENGPTIRVVPREAVIAHSRRTYARTRGEVEAEIESMMNWKKPQPSSPTRSGTSQQQTARPPIIPPPAVAPEQADLHSQLLDVGLLPEQDVHRLGKSGRHLREELERRFLSKELSRKKWTSKSEQDKRKRNKRNFIYRKRPLRLQSLLRDKCSRKNFSPQRHIIGLWSG